MYQPRIPIKFQSAAGDEEFVFPRAEYSFELEGGLYVPEAPLTGAHGSLDLLGRGVAPKQATALRLSFAVYEDSPEDVDAVVDEMLAKLHRYGLGKLWTEGRDALGDPELRWTWARAVSMPRLSWEAGEVLSKRALCAFRCEPFWYGAALEITEHDLDEPAQFTVASDPDTFTVDNPGSARVYNAIIELAGTFTDPVITNLTNGYRLATLRDGASANDVVRFDAGRPAVEFSDDAGATWSGDYGNFVRRTGQVQLMVLEPGENQFEISGATGAVLTLAASAAYH